MNKSNRSPLNIRLFMCILLVIVVIGSSLSNSSRIPQLATATSTTNGAKALTKTPLHTVNMDFFTPLVKKGIGLIKSGKYNESIASFDKALSIHHITNHSIYIYPLVNKGIALLKLGKYNESIASFDRALAINPNYYYALLEKASALLKLGKYNESITYLDKILAVKPNDIYALNYKKIDLAALNKLKIMTGSPAKPNVPNTAALKKTNITSGYVGVTPPSDSGTFGYYFGSPHGNATTALNANATTALNATPPHAKYYCMYSYCITHGKPF